MYLSINATINNPLNSYEEAAEFLIHLADKVGVVISTPEVNYVITPGNQGVTATALTEGGKISFHIWDENQPATLDFEMVGVVDKTLAINAISRKFDATGGTCRVYAGVDGPLVEESSF